MPTGGAAGDGPAQGNVAGGAMLTLQKRTVGDILLR